MKNALILTLLTLGLFGCKIGDDDQPDRDLFNFLVGVNVSPLKSEYGAGDILRLEVNLPDKVFSDVQTGQMVTVGNAIFSFESRAELIQVEPIPDTTARFDLILQNGVADPAEDFEETARAGYSFGCPENNYSFNVGLQLKEPGNYLLILNDLNELSLILFTEDSDCAIQNMIPPPDDADQAFVRFFFDEDDVNLEELNELVENNPGPVTQYYRELLTNKLAFFVKVR